MSAGGTARPRREAVLLLGPTGSGKTPLGEALECCGLCGRRCAHFDFGAELRRGAAGGGGGLTAAERRFLEGVLASGALLEDEHFGLARKILRGWARRRRVGRRDLMVMNGLPRHAGQATALERDLRVVCVVRLLCGTRSVIARLRDNRGGDRTGRADDDAALVRRKLAVFNARTAPLLDHYRHKGVRILCIRVRADSTVGETVEAVRRAWAGAARVHERNHGHQGQRRTDRR